MVLEQPTDGRQGPLPPTGAAHEAAGLPQRRGDVVEQPAGPAAGGAADAHRATSIQRGEHGVDGAEAAESGQRLDPDGGAAGPAEHGEHGGGGGRALLGVEGEERVDGGDDLGGGVGRQSSEGLGGLGRPPDDELVVATSAVGERAGERRVDHEPDGVQIRAGVGAATLPLLRGEPGGGADGDAGGGHAPAEGGPGGEAEVQDGRSALGVDEHVGGLEIPVEDAGGVHPGEGLEEGDGGLGEAPPGVTGRTREGRPVDQLGDQEGGAVVPALVEQAHDAGQPQQAKRRDLPPDPGVVPQRDAVQELEGDIPAPQLVVDPVDAAAAALPQLGPHRVSPRDQRRGRQAGAEREGDGRVEGVAHRQTLPTEADLVVGTRSG